MELTYTSQKIYMLQIKKNEKIPRSLSRQNCISIYLYMGNFKQFQMSNVSPPTENELNVTVITPNYRLSELYSY